MLTQDFNRYAYVGGDPVNRIDPTGAEIDEIVVTGTRSSRNDNFANDDPGGGSFDNTNFQAGIFSLLATISNEAGNVVEFCQTNEDMLALEGMERLVQTQTQPQRKRIRISKLGVLRALRSGVLAIPTLLQTGVRNDPRIPIFRGVDGGELADIFSTFPPSFRPGRNTLGDKQFFLTISGVQQFASSELMGVEAIVMTSVRQSTIQQGTPLSLPSGESAGAGAISFPPSALASLNADAAQTGIQVIKVESCNQ